MQKRVQIIQKSTVFKKFIFQVDEARLRHELYNGNMSDEIVRLNFERGDSVAALMHNPQNDTFVLTEQFRYPTYEKEGGWISEIPAGMVEKGEDPTETMRREILEETGYVPDDLRHIYTFFVTPGGSSERIFLFYVRINPKGRIGKGGGLIKEGENIKVDILPVEDVLARLARNEIHDAKSILALQWFILNRSHLK